MDGDSHAEIVLTSAKGLAMLAGHNGTVLWKQPQRVAFGLPKPSMVPDVVLQPQDTGRRVAIKVLREGISSSDSAKRRFKREVELVARLQHPAISTIVDARFHRGHYFYVMEYIEGRSLGEVFSHGQHDVCDMLRMIIDICDAIDYAHQRGIVHRDLKPSNILVDMQGRPRILDFGLAKSIDDTATGSSKQTLSTPGQIIGTLAYMSPEQSRGDLEQIDVRSDVYSLGAIAYELVTGELPSRMGGPLLDVLDRIAHKEPARPTSLLRRSASRQRDESRQLTSASKDNTVSHRTSPKNMESHSARRSVDADLDAILLKALAKEPRQRYANAREMAEDMRRWLDGHGVRARRAGSAERFWRWVRHAPWSARLTATRRRRASGTRARRQSPPNLLSANGDLLVAGSSGLRLNDLATPYLHGEIHSSLISIPKPGASDGVMKPSLGTGVPGIVSV